MLHKTISRLILQLHRALLSIKYLMRKYKESFFQTTKGILITRYIRNYVRFIKFIRQMQTISALYKPRFKSPGKDFFYSTCLFYSAIAVPVDSAYFGSGTQAFRVLLDGIKCGGTESNVGLCHTGFWGVNDCDHDEDAGLLCIGIIYLIASISFHLFYTSCSLNSHQLTYNVQ